MLLHCPRYGICTLTYDRDVDCHNIDDDRQEMNASAPALWSHLRGLAAKSDLATSMGLLCIRTRRLSDLGLQAVYV